MKSFHRLVLAAGLLVAAGPIAGSFGAAMSSANDAASASRPASTATYRVTFQSTWSAATHPQDFPGNPHFSGLIGATHNAGVSFWGVADVASEGIESMAETGSKSLLTSEVNAAISTGAAEFLLSGGGISLSPGQVTMQFDLSDAYPHVTLVSMVAPSPDWFVGVAGLNLRPSGEWVPSLVVPLVVYDAGTDGGISYTSPDDDLDPAQPISELTDVPFDAAQQVGTFTFELLSIVGVESGEAPGDVGAVSVYPNPTSGSVLVELEDGTASGRRVRVFDVLGRVVESRFEIDGGRLTIDLAEHPRGLYVISISDDSRTVTVPVVVAR